MMLKPTGSVKCKQKLFFYLHSKLPSGRKFLHCLCKRTKTSEIFRKAGSSTLRLPLKVWGRFFALGTLLHGKRPILGLVFWFSSIGWRIHHQKYYSTPPVELANSREIFNFEHVSFFSVSLVQETSDGGYFGSKPCLSGLTRVRVRAQMGQDLLFLVELQLRPSEDITL